MQSKHPVTGVRIYGKLRVLMRQSTVTHVYNNRNIYNRVAEAI